MCRSPRRKHLAGVTLLAWAKILHLAFAGEVGGKTSIAHEKTTCRGQTSASAKKPPSCDGGGAETKIRMFGWTDIPGHERTAGAARSDPSCPRNNQPAGVRLLVWDEHPPTRICNALDPFASNHTLDRRLYWASMMRSITTKLGRQTCLLLLSPKSTFNLISNKHRCILGRMLNYAGFFLTSLTAVPLAPSIHCRPSRWEISEYLYGDGDGNPVTVS